MGEPVEVWEERLNDLSPYQVNQKLMDNVPPRPNSCTACPPTTTIRPPSAKRWANGSMGRDGGHDEVFEGPASIVFDEAENRMHTIKAVMAATL